MILDRARAHRIVEDAVGRAAALGRPICVAVTDERGALLAFSRMDNSPVRSVKLSEAKAYTAARLAVSTTAFGERLRRDGIVAADFADPLLVALPGGALVRDAGGAVIGGVGISGLTPAEDQAIADASAGAEELSR